MTRAFLFRILALLFAGAAIYHAIAFIAPGFSDGGAHGRHAVFFAIDLLCAGYLLRRPRWFVAAFGLLTLQALWSHGSHAWFLWHTQRRQDWLSFAVILVVPFAWALLVEDCFHGVADRVSKDRGILH